MDLATETQQHCEQAAKKGRENPDGLMSKAADGLVNPPFSATKPARFLRGGAATARRRKQWSPTGAPRRHGEQFSGKAVVWDNVACSTASVV